jgi:anti-sigma regulatory factor (Ser/Thr protein kinase)
LNKHKIFYAQLDLLHPMLSWIRGAFKEMRFDESTVRKLEIAMEEALVNIIHHAYQDKPGDIDVLISSVPGESITITLKDEGPAFNPLEKSPTAIDASTPLEEIEEGGLGILFMKEYMDDISYQRQDSYNILILTKKVH